MYTINHSAGDFTYTRLHDATTRARRIAEEGGGEVKVVHAETEAIVFAISVPAIRKVEEGKDFTPWTRIEQPTFAAPAFDGWIPGYTRKRIQATVYRGQEGQENPWRVFDGRTGRYQDVRTTKDARLLTNAMRAGLLL